MLAPEREARMGEITEYFEKKAPKAVRESIENAEKAGFSTKTTPIQSA